MFQFQDVTATKKIFQLTKRIRAIAGGTGAAKTISILVWLIDYCQVKENRNKVCTVVSESHPHLEKGAILDFKNIMRDRGYWKDSRWNETKHVYTFETGNVLEFYSVDKFGKAHGPRRDVLFLNEANNIDYIIADQLITRTREIVWMDWNPSEEFWFYTEMKPVRTDIDFITLTYLDNEALDKGSLDEILAHKENKNWWAVYALGQLGEITTRIYTGWQLIDEIPHEARLERYGLDFGYTNDSTSLIAVYYYNGGYIWDEIAYGKGMSNKDIADILVNLEKKVLVVADSAEPKSIDEIKEYYKNIIGVSKTKGESKSDNFVKWSIGIVQNEKISITKRSVQSIKEYRNLLWLTDKKGNILNVEDPRCKNDAMSAGRYAMTSLIPIIRRKEMMAIMPRLEQKKPIQYGL